MNWADFFLLIKWIYNIIIYNIIELTPFYIYIKWNSVSFQLYFIIIKTFIIIITEIMKKIIKI